MHKLIKAMHKELHAHFLDYLVLITGGVFFLLLLKTLSADKTSMFIVILLFTSFYIVWGVYHHTSTKTLHMKNVVEYILIGFIVLFLVTTFLF